MLGALKPALGGGGGGAVSSVYGRAGAVAAVAGDYSAAQIAGLGASAGNLVLTPRATQTITAATSIAIGGAIVPITATGAITLTSNPQIAVGTNGQRITIINVGSSGITFVNGNGLLLPQASIPLYGGRMVSFTYVAAYSSWLLDSFIPESVTLTGAPTTPTAGLNTNSTQIASTAYVNQSNRPYMAAGRITANQPIATGSWVKLIFNGETSDLNSIYDPATGIAVVPAGAAGIYVVNAGVYMDGGSSNLGLSIYNAATNTEIKRICTHFASADSVLLASGTTTVPLNSSDQIDVRVSHVNAGNLGRNLVADPKYSYMSIFRLNA